MSTNKKRQTALIKSRLMSELNRLLGIGFTRDSLAAHLGIGKRDLENDLTPSRESIPTTARLSMMGENSRNKSKGVEGLYPFDSAFVLTGITGIDYSRVQAETNLSLQKEVVRLLDEVGRLTAMNERLQMELKEMREGMRETI